MTNVNSRFSLRSNIIWSLVGNLGYAFTQWAVIAALAKLGGPEEVGDFSLGLAISAPVAMFANLQLRRLIATDAGASFRLRHYLILRLIMASLAFLITFSVSIVLGMSIRLTLVITVVALVKVVDSVSDILYGFWQQREQMKPIAVSMIANGCLTVIAFSTLYLLTNNLIVSLTASLIASLLILLVYNVRITSQLAGLEKAELSKILLSVTLRDLTPIRFLGVIALPLGLAALLGSLNANVPRFFVSQFLGQTELGIYAGLAYMLVAGKTAIGALAGAMSPRLGIYIRDNDRVSFVKLLKVGCLAGTIGAAILLVVVWIEGPLLLRVFYTEEYAPFTTLLAWLVLATGMEFVIAMLEMGLTAARAIRIQASSQLVTLALNGGLCIALIPHWGLNGVGVAAVASATARLALYSVFTYRYLSSWKSGSGRASFLGIPNV
jgi:O-antigen/teichoic acid export membrane protein